MLHDTASPHTFAALFHQPIHIMKIHIFVFLLVMQSLGACQQGQDNVQTLAANIVAPSLTVAENAPPSATDIVFQSEDGGQTWQDVSAGLPKDLQPGVVFADGGEIVLSTQYGLYRSSNTSADLLWKKAFLTEDRITHIFQGSSGLYACSYGRGLFQNLPGTDIWMNLNITLKDRSVRTVLETRDRNLFVGTDNGIFKSADGGQTWKQVCEGGLVLDIVESDGVLIAGGARGVLRSTDGGEHWDVALNESILAKKTGLIGDRFFTILGTKDASKVNPEGITSRLRVSTDGGKTWQRMDRALGPLPCVYEMDERLSEALDIYDIVQAGEYLFCSFDTGIFRSSDYGKSWELVFPSDGKTAFRFAVSGKRIYAVKGFAGC